MLAIVSKILQRKKKLENFKRSNNYLQLLYREVKGSLLYPGFPRPILLTKHPEHSEECLVTKIGRENEKKMQDFF